MKAEPLTDVEKKICAEHFARHVTRCANCNATAFEYRMLSVLSDVEFTSGQVSYSFVRCLTLMCSKCAESRLFVIADIMARWAQPAPEPPVSGQ